MTIDIFGFKAEGEPSELAWFVFVLVSLFQAKKDADTKKEVDAWLAKYGDKTFEELMNVERGCESGEKEGDQEQ